VVVSGILAGPPGARAQGVAALSAAGFPIVGATAVELASLGSSRESVGRVSTYDTATALGRVAVWSTVGVVVTGSVATLVLRDDSGAIQASLVVPAHAVTSVGLRAGDRVRATTAEAGTILHKDERVLAFVAGDDQQHLVQHDAVVAH
jgi:hypothetical protein